MAPPRKISSWFKSKSADPEARAAREAQRAQEKAEREEAQRRERRRKAIYASNIVEERGIEEDLLLRMGWQRIFEVREWTKLAAKPRPANVDIVREFYFNMDPSSFDSTREVVVRGCTVDVTPESINSYFGTPNIPTCRFGLTMEVLLTTDEEILRDICGPAHNKTVDYTKLGDFCYEAHLWNLFVSYAITPVGRRSGFTTDRLHTIYALKNGHAIDLGQLIFKQLEEHGKGAENRSLIFPSLITALCENAGVLVDGPGAVLTSPTMIDFKSINYIRNLRNMPKLLNSRDLAREERRAAQASSSQHSSSSVSRPSTSARRSTSEPELTDLLRQNNEIQQQIMATQQEMMATMMRNRAEDQDTILQLKETIARLETKMQELQGKLMHGQTYQRRSVSRS